MLYKFLKLISDWFYLVPLTMRKFQKNNPDETIHAYGAVKAHRHDTERPLAAYGWRFARRGTLILTDKRFVCGDWEIPLDKVKYAEAVMFSSAFILKVADSSSNHYQFAVQKDPMWMNQSVLSIKMMDELIEPYKVRSIDKMIGVVIYGILALGLFFILRDIFLWLF